VNGPLQVLIPVSRLDRAKTRLAEVLTPSERRDLALITLQTVLDAVREAGWKAVVLTSDADVRDAAGDVMVIEETGDGLGLNGELEKALSRLAATEILILHADLPLVDGPSLGALAGAAAPAPSVTLVQSPDGGTNAMLLRPPGMFALAYGAKSFEKHVRAAKAVGMTVTTVESDRLSIDLDTAADVRHLLDSPQGRASAAGKYLGRNGAGGFPEPPEAVS
jgi:2-phospho-L-lactate guanylyltransferase